MKRLLSLLIAVGFAVGFISSIQASQIISSADPSLVGGTVIDFESQAAGSYTTLAIGDVTFSTGEALYISNAYSGNYNTTGQSLQNPYGTNSFGTLNINFASSVNAFGFNWGASDTQWTLFAYDSSNTLLESFALPITYGSNAGEFYGLAVTGIASATLIGASGDYIFVDNFTYSQVPEPSTLLLLGSGLIGLGYFGRKRMKRK
mgnify:FL=1